MAKAVQPGLVIDQGIPLPICQGSVPLEAGLRVFQDFKDWRRAATPARSAGSLGGDPAPQIAKREIW